MDREQMPKLNLAKDQTFGEGPKLTATHLYHMKQVEQANRARVERLLKLRTNNRIYGTLLGTLALSIYGYSMYAVKQEKFLDDFEEPATVSDEQ